MNKNSERNQEIAGQAENGLRIDRHGVWAGNPVGTLHRYLAFGGVSFCLASWQLLPIRDDRCSPKMFERSEAVTQNPFSVTLTKITISDLARHAPCFTYSVAGSICRVQCLR